MSKNIMYDFYDAWQYLDNHCIFKDKNDLSHFTDCIFIEIVKVNPENNTLEDNKKLNTKVETWLECGPYIGNDLAHDINLDCGANTFELAIIELAKLVKKYYGDDEKTAKEKIKKDYFIGQDSY